MKPLENIRSTLQLAIKPSKDNDVVFYKTSVGEYAEHDQFINVNVPTLRKISKEFKGLPRKELHHLIQSAINEERLLALFILIEQYQKSDLSNKDELYQFYMNNLKYVNNWNLVDSSAHLILGEYIFDKDKTILIRLAGSDIIWERRIAIIATLYFIRQKDLEWTFKISELLLNDSHDLIHKAAGWMLREAGKKDREQLMRFLDQYANLMPRTMLRYAIEKFPAHQRKAYLMLKKH